VLFNDAIDLGTGGVGLVRVGGGDLAEVRPAVPDGVELFRGGCPLTGPCVSRYKFPISAGYVPLVVHGEYIYGVGGNMLGSACNRVYRAMLRNTARYVEAGSYVSPAYDLGFTCSLTGVSWSFTKFSDVRDDDWAMVRYRAADEGGTWTCWTPRFPEEGSLPEAAGTYTYSNPAETVRTREPLIPGNIRYIQFEVSLYNKPANDFTSATLTVPRFDEFRIEYNPLVPPAPPRKAFELFPIPAKDTVNLRFQVIPEGGEVEVRIYNVAGNLVAKTNYVYVPEESPVKSESISVSRLAPGAYILVIEGRGATGGPGLAFKWDRYKKLTSKFVIRR
jgi:hypothetical protein